MSAEDDQETIMGNPADLVKRDHASEADAREGICQGLEDMAAGRTRSAREAFEKLRSDLRLVEALER